MAAILGIYASQISGHLYAGPFGAYDAIASVTVGSSGVSSVSFNGIPTGYKHLQIRVFAQETRATYGIADIGMTFNSDTAANYSVHGFYGDGSSVAPANNVNTQSSITFGEGTIGTTTGGTFGIAIIDILDYANTSKYKTTRTLTGVDINGTLAGYGGRVGIWSGNWRNTDAVSSITINAAQSPFTQYSSFAIYGVK